MTLAQVQFGALIVTALALSWAALTAALAVALPGVSVRAETALEQNTRACVGRGVAAGLLAIVAALMLQIPAPLVKAGAITVLLFLGGVFLVGAAGFARLLGRRISELSGVRSSFHSLAWGCLLYSFASLFPLLGWYLFLPASTVCALGAGWYVLIRRLPRRSALSGGAAGAVSA